MRLDYHTLDVFTDTRFGGNPLAVILEADGLDDKRMQMIAREFNLSETVFVLRPQNQSHTARIRIFTPGGELPFAGHPTVGTAVLLAHVKGAELPTPGDALIVLEAPIGVLRVGVRIRAGAAPFAEFDAPRLPEDSGPLPPLEKIAAAVSLIPAEIGFENYRPTKFVAGNTVALVPVASLDAIGKARVASHHWEATMKEQRLLGAFLFCRQALHTTSAFHARFFAPDFGIAEDPATGSAAVAFAGAIHRFDALPDGLHRRLIEQGYEMGRPSQIALSLQVARGKLEAVRIGGHAVRVAKGVIEV